MLFDISYAYNNKIMVFSHLNAQSRIGDRYFVGDWLYFGRKYLAPKMLRAFLCHATETFA